MRVDGQSDIPEARRILTELADLISLEGLPRYAAYVQTIRRQILPLLDRHKPTRRATKKRRDPNSDQRQAIRQFAAAYPHLNFDEIGRVFNVTGGRVSEALREKS